MCCTVAGIRGLTSTMLMDTSDLLVLSLPPIQIFILSQLGANLDVATIVSIMENALSKVLY